MSPGVAYLPGDDNTLLGVGNTLSSTQNAFVFPCGSARPEPKRVQRCSQPICRQPRNLKILKNPLFAKYRWVRSSADLVDEPLKIDSTVSHTERPLGTAPDGFLPQPLDKPTSGAEIRRIAL